MLSLFNFCPVSGDGQPLNQPIIHSPQHLTSHWLPEHFIFVRKKDTCREVRRKDLQGLGLILSRLRRADRDAGLSVSVTVLNADN